MTVYPLQASFVRGELAEKLRGRVDIEQYGQGLADATNWLVMPQGGLERRPGTKFVHRLTTDAVKGRLVEFEFNEEQAYCIVFCGSAISFATLGAPVTLTAQNITAISKANPGVLTYSGSDTYATGDRLLIRDAGGMTELNNRVVRAGTVNTGSNTIELTNLDATNLDTSGFTTYTSGGTVAELYLVQNTTYTEGILFDLQFAQAGDTIYIADDGTAPGKLKRTSETSWTLSTIEFEDGPWLPEDTEGTTLTPAATGSVIDVAMTSNSTSSYTAADDNGGTDSWKVFDQDLSTGLTLAAGAVDWVSIDFPSTNTKVADAYWLTATASPELMPTHWVVEGDTGSAWVVVDARAGETAWASGERRYYEFSNATAYRGYRLRWFAVDGGATSAVAEWTIHQAASDQTAFNLTASAITGINGGTGFQTTDVGRTIRLMGSDGVWRWARIISRTSTTVVTIRLYFHALLDLTPITRWQLSAFSASDGYPAAVGFYQDRLSWAGTTTQPRTVWASESANYESHHLSEPLVESDAIAAEMTGNQISAVRWIEELGELLAGTGGAIRALGPAAQAEPFSSFNIRAVQVSTVGAAKMQPLVVTGGLLYMDRYRKRVMAFRAGEGGGMVADEISWWSDHLFADGITDMAFQEDRFNVAWFVTATGGLVACTYQPEFGVVGFTPITLGGAFSTGDAVVESVAAIPSSGGAAVYLLVKRTINGATVRYLEYFSLRHETGDTLADAVYLDSAVTYSGSSTTTVTGVTHLIGQTVGIFVNGVDVGDAVVSSSGTVTSPTAGTKITVGLRYTSRAEMLPPPTTGNRDGSSMGRQQKIHDVALNLLNAAGLKVGSLSGTARDFPHRDRAADAGSFNTGIFPALPIDGRWRDDAVPVITTDKAYPATIRAVVVGLEGAP